MYKRQVHVSTRLWSLPHPDLNTVWAVSATLVVSFYAARECSDELKHKRLGEWNKRANEDKVSWSNDQKGDLVGPVTNWLAALGCWAVL